MNVFFEEDGSFKIASIMSETQGALQVESVSGKRTKVKASNVLMRFETPLAGFMEAANTEAETLELDFLWECCGETEFGFEEFSTDYYGRKPTSIEAAAIAIKLHSAPVYFNRKGKGRYKAAPAEILKAALAGLEKKRLLAEKMAAFVEDLKSHKMPEDLMQKRDMLLYEPDKNAFEYKTLDAAANALHLSHLKLMHFCGAIPSVHDYHLGAFLREYFAKGTDFTAEQIAEIAADLSFDLPMADAEAFSIDDSTTTEIDDAFSIKQLADGITRVGIHIAAPALGINVEGTLDKEVMQRLSTVYMPGNKITMLPESAIRPFSLDAGEIKPVLSLYLHVNEALEIIQRDSKVELIKVAENLRHDTLEPFFNEGTLEADSGHPYWAKLLYLFNLAVSLEKSRGKYDPTKPPQVDYNFYVTDDKVSIVGRHRGSPMDKLVAELMIEANNQWGALLASHEVPGLYRAQMGGRVYMTTKAEPHQGLGVAQYAWSTSPLRRAVDLINQRQIISVVQNDQPAYPQNSDALTTHMRNFELTYKAYSEFQTRMERYWCLQYLIQENVQEVHATVWRENLVRLDNMPYMTKVYGLPELKSGTRVSLQVQEVDTLLLDLRTKFVQVLEEAAVALDFDDADSNNEVLEVLEPELVDSNAPDLISTDIATPDDAVNAETI
ncbi:MAG: RNB domain-containing ribonuclease [Methylotenera sp.]|uniref:ribonuclease catalytic domain-containing protein n=1 Tax=Methylotenera sp. TaxID=2051956 RepID=UPI002488DF89|nr:RNB domain-containing ribonuclease [Methylotenera sp.]MDI1307978.1 RNB domain-containing ribonuclease [Methylotenera sp.]